MSASFLRMSPGSPRNTGPVGGASAVSQAGMGAFQEMAQAEMAAPVTKAAWMSESPDDVAADFAKAMRLARSGRQGPVHLSLPADCLDDATTGPLPRPEDFEPRIYGRAIGGVQIVKGATVREMGYCADQPRYQRPASRWCDTSEDSAFRRQLGSCGQPIGLPNVRRIRHSKRGSLDINVEL